MQHGVTQTLHKGENGFGSRNYSNGGGLDAWWRSAAWQVCRDSSVRRCPWRSAGLLRRCSGVPALRREAREIGHGGGFQVVVFCSGVNRLVLFLIGLII